MTAEHVERVRVERASRVVLEALGLRADELPGRGRLGQGLVTPPRPKADPGDREPGFAHQGGREARLDSQPQGSACLGLGLVVALGALQRTCPVHPGRHCRDVVGAEHRHAGSAGTVCPPPSTPPRSATWPPSPRSSPPTATASSCAPTTRRGLPARVHRRPAVGIGRRRLRPGARRRRPVSNQPEQPGQGDPAAPRPPAGALGGAACDEAGGGAHRASTGFVAGLSNWSGPAPR